VFYASEYDKKKKKDFSVKKLQVIYLGPKGIGNLRLINGKRVAMSYQIRQNSFRFISRTHSGEGIFVGRNMVFDGEYFWGAGWTHALKVTFYKQ
jgi:hypothetical protein